MVLVIIVVITYTNAVIGKKYLLVIHTAIYMNGMEDNLIHPFILRLTGYQVNECSNLLSKEPTTFTHTL